MRRTSDAILAGLAVTHGAALVVWPAAPLIAIGIWWNSNTIAHNFIHRPFFRARLPNRVFDAYQSVIMGIPQTLWRERHLAHHAGLAWKPRISASLVVEFTLILGIWLGLALTSPTYFATVYAPGYLAGLLLCAVQGHYEHAGATTSHYGRLYNLLCFNDGYHVEHHRYPGVHWSELPARVQADARSSRWPALVRWLDLASLDRLEHLVLRAPWLQALVLAAHRRAFRQLLCGLDTPRQVLIVGGGLFPRTALILNELVPRARLEIIDADPTNLEIGRRAFERAAGGTCCRFDCRRFTGSEPDGTHDVVVVPLAYDGDRHRIYEHPPAPTVIVHDWLWRRRGESSVVSWFLFKRLNLVRR